MIHVQEEDFDIGEICRELRSGREDAGALVTFTGMVRSTKSQPVEKMSLEHYPGMTEKQIAAIEQQARQRWSLLDSRVIHRIGMLYPGDNIVLVATLAQNRAAAFEAAAFIMDYLKTDAPFWKKEYTPQGARWVDARESDERAKARWRGEA